ncbi:MAG: hypothetical protein A2521_07280 [Deltaproteobacteria bacterium RIFOXYD12_FULL_57_12]|nr:MAG: hypothetical protein A2521_07280 [Deltaproteobacteria bacterium RIFOXYD12_FULL_57_12]
MKVLLIAACTLCGRISPAGMGSMLDRQRLESFRASTDASLIGAGTLRHDDPEMRGPAGRLDPKRLRAVLTGSGDIPVVGKKLFSHEPPPLVFTATTHAKELTARLGCRGRVVGLPAGPAGLSIAAAIAELASLGARSVLLEGGGRLNYAALKEKVVDELLITLVPSLSGDTDATSLVAGNGPLGSPFLPLTLVSAEPVSTGEIFLHYRRGDGHG